MAENLPALVLVPDEIWSEFQSVLAKCGITMVSTDGVRSYRAKKTVHNEPAAVERDYEGHVIGEDGLVDGPGGQRLKPVVDPWPGINARRQAEGSA